MYGWLDGGMAVPMADETMDGWIECWMDTCLK